jgi:hypothetical protein
MVGTRFSDPDCIPGYQSRVIVILAKAAIRRSEVVTAAPDAFAGGSTGSRGE